MKTEKTLNNIKSDEIANCVNGLIAHIERLELHADHLYSLTQHLQAKLKDRDKTIEKMTEMLEDKDKKLNYYMGRKQSITDEV